MKKLKLRKKTMPFNNDEYELFVRLYRRNWGENAIHGRLTDKSKYQIRRLIKTYSLMYPYVHSTEELKKAGIRRYARLRDAERRIDILADLKPKRSYKRRSWLEKLLSFIKGK